MRIRKSTLAMTSEEWSKYNNAINIMVNSGKWRTLTLYHSDPTADHRMHGSMSGPVGYARFLYWHRAYVLECEDAFREIDDTITIPYWDWINSETVPNGLDHMPIRGVNRNTGTINFTSASEIDRIKRKNSFDDFSRDLEVYPHNSGHNWVGGIMSNPMDSPTDPLFYMHHANIDRIWSEWQAKPGNQDKKPDLNAADSKLDPWEDKWNVDKLQSISELGEYQYKYAPVFTQSDQFSNSEILNRLRSLESMSWPLPRELGPFPRSGPRPDPVPFSRADVHHESQNGTTEHLSREEIAMIRMMRANSNFS